MSYNKNHSNYKYKNKNRNYHTNDYKKDEVVKGENNVSEVKKIDTHKEKKHPFVNFFLFLTLLSSLAFFGITLWKGQDQVDFFPSKRWRDDFEEIISAAQPDYLIGSTHSIRTEDESLILNLYHLKESNCSASMVEEFMVNYWQNIIESIKSGYFDFIAHLDVCKLFNLGIEPKWDVWKRKVIDTLAEYNHPYELNTSGWRKVGEQHPHLWMIEELNNRQVPLIISDDAHTVEHIDYCFDRAESLLQSINYKNRYKPEIKI